VHCDSNAMSCTYIKSGHEVSNLDGEHKVLVQELALECGLYIASLCANKFLDVVEHIGRDRRDRYKFYVLWRCMGARRSAVVLVTMMVTSGN
jgi:hypothetical protein